MFQMKIWKEYWNYWINRRISFELILFLGTKYIVDIKNVFLKTCELKIRKKIEQKIKIKKKINKK